ncbi:MAG: TIGR02281 family clan AA aspartic protease, partial [Halioglobus sp.]|nr:TIGR02281 family clan AA aspartic protease [Halioglobus sp.]
SCRFEAEQGMSFRASIAAALVAFWATTAPALAAPDIAVEGLLPNAAVISVGGERKMLRPGNSHRGVKLLAVGATTATLEIDGRRVELGLSQHVGTRYEEPVEIVVTIPRGANMRYETNAMINGRQIMAIVDTGATSVAMSQRHADALGIDYFNGRPSQAQTASGMVNARVVQLDSVSIGGIRVNSVPGMVLEGDFPRVVLLGMTWLQHVTFTEKDGLMTLSRPQ